MARAYLVAMRLAGLLPRRIVLMIPEHHPASGKRIGRWLPGAARRRYARAAQDASMNYWPRILRRRHSALVRVIADSLSPAGRDAEACIREMYDSFDYARYAESPDTVFADRVRADAVGRKLDGAGTVLYTGGGIVPATLLAGPGIRMLHVHPGYLPAVRGADGLLWSILVERAIGMSAFFMEPGIDTGPILARARMPVPTVKLSGSRPDDGVLYRAVFSFLDPLLRAFFLVDSVLSSSAEPLAAPGTPQSRAEGVTYHFMHPRVRSRALELLFR